MSRKPHCSTAGGCAAALGEFHTVWVVLPLPGEEGMRSTAFAEPQQKEPGAEREASHDKGDGPTANTLVPSPTVGHGTMKQFKKSGKNKPSFHRQAPLLACSALV